MTVILPSMINNRLSMFDVGHGDSILIQDEKGHSLLVDVGSSTPHKYSHVPLIVNSGISPGRCGLVISHLHWDHYSLFRYFQKAATTFSKLYLPDLPMTGANSNATQAIFDFLRVAIALDFGRYRLLPEILANSHLSRVWCSKGTIIDEINPKLRVIWPDFSKSILSKKSFSAIAVKVRNKIEPIIRKYQIRTPPEMPADYSMDAFFRDIERQELIYREIPEDETAKKSMYRVLAEAERIFLPLANMFSLAFRTNYHMKPRFLFLGDLPEKALNQIQLPKSRFYEFIKAAHHGTEYGSSLRNVVTNYLLISRADNGSNLTPLNQRYINRNHFNMLLSTSYLGDCYFL